MNPSSSANDGSALKLPRFVLDTDTVPEGRRLNIYSKPEYLGFIADLLRGSSDWKRLSNSQFGRLFKLPVSRCAHSGKLLHALLCRQLYTKKVHELWIVYGGKPIRFSLREFHLTTGLLCHPLPSEETVEDHLHSDSVWNQLFGTRSVVYVDDVVEMLSSVKEREPQQRMSASKRFSLVLILLLDGVIVCNDRYGKITPEFVEMLNDIDFFLSYPWGRKSFIATLSRFGPPEGSETPIADLTVRLKQKTSATYGFPLALQLQALESIPLLLAKIPNPNDLRNFTERPCQGFSNTVILLMSHVLDVERDAKLSVNFTVTPNEDSVECDYSWDNETADPSVDMILELIQSNHEWKALDWSVLDTSPTSVHETEHVLQGQTTEIEDPVKKSAAVKGNRAKVPTRSQASTEDTDDVEDITLGGINGLKEFIVHQNELLFQRIMGELNKRLPVAKSPPVVVDLPPANPPNLRRSGRLKSKSDEFDVVRMGEPKGKKRKITPHIDFESPVDAESEPRDESPLSLDQSDDADRWDNSVGVQEITEQISNRKAGTASTETSLLQKEHIKMLEYRLANAEHQLREGELFRKKLHNTILELKGNIRVFCRVRPLLPDDGGGGNQEASVIAYPTSTESRGRGIDVVESGNKYHFTFDKVFDHRASQEEVFFEISELVQSAMDGSKVCIFAYGQTGSGKTYTMMGRPEAPEQKGLIPRSIEKIFETSQSLSTQGWKCKMLVSMLEIYNESIRDLLSTNKTIATESACRTPGRQYTITHDANGNTKVSDLTIVDVCSIEEFSSLLQQAARSRSVGKTHMNEESSRSHFVLTLRISGVNESTEQQFQGVLNLIDLAGSERLSKSLAAGERLKETQAINKSLSALGDVINALVMKEVHVPFRNSKLTHLLQPCLGGDSKTLMFVNISPDPSSSGESLCSLRFADRVNACEIGIPSRQTAKKSARKI